jgi:nickel-dependent lactate racemase
VKIPIHYCDGKRDLVIPESCKIDVYALPEDRLRPLDEKHWFNTGVLPAQLKSFLASSDELLIVVNDQFRPTPTEHLLNVLEPHIDLDKTTFLVAAALHHAPNEAELQKIFGDRLDRIRDRVRVHDAFANDQLHEFGSGKSKVQLNKLLDQFQRILTIGSVEPHYFAGFTGGRKIFLPGCASFDDTRSNHALAVSDASQPLATKGNPVWEDIQRRTECLSGKDQFSIQVVAGHEGTVLCAECGRWDEAFTSASRFLSNKFAHPVKERYDVVVSVVYPPLDRNLYQLQKSYENVADAVRDGGSVLLVSCCQDGVGNDRFLALAEAQVEGWGSKSTGPEDAAMGIHKVVRTTKLSKRIDLWLVSSLPDETLYFLPITPKGDINSAISELVQKHGNNCRIAVLLDSASQVLYRQGTVNADSASTKEEKDYA